MATQQIEQQLRALRNALTECAGKINERDRERALRQQIRELEADLEAATPNPFCINRI